MEHYTHPEMSTSQLDTVGRHSVLGKYDLPSQVHTLLVCLFSQSDFPPCPENISERAVGPGKQALVWQFLRMLAC